MNRTTRWLALAATLVLLAWPAARAHEGHDQEAAPAASAPAAPALAGLRFAAASEAFELVGLLDGRQLTLWLDRAATNAPVTRGTLELELGELKLVARPAGETWAVTLPRALPPGTVPVTASLAVDGEADLLAAELEVPAPSPAAAAAPLARNTWLAAGAALLSAAVALLAWRRARRRLLD